MLRDLRHAVHTLSRSPGYTLLCVAVLALGIGANAAIFSVLDSVVLHALPYPDPARLVFVWERFPGLPPPVGPRMFVAKRNYEEWRRQTTVFSAMAAFEHRTLDDTSSGHPRHVDTGFASAELFPLLGVQAKLGRTFTQTDDRTAILTDTFFERQFNRNPAAIGRTLTLGGAAYTVIGVLPPRFHTPSTYEGSEQMSPEVWLPLVNLPVPRPQQTERTMMVMARLKPTATLAQARAEMVAIGDRLAKADSEHNKGWTTSVFDVFTEDTNPEVHRALYVLMAAVGFLLLIACANLANLTMARATLRSREMAVRLALGATRARLVSQLIAEPLLLSVAGTGAGLLLAKWCIGVIVAYKPEDIQRTELISINLTVLAFSALAGVATAILFGLAPALSASRADLNTALKSGGAGGSSASRLRSRQFLIAFEVALALVLVTGAGLMMRSFQRLLDVGVGFRTERLTIADIDLPETRYRDEAARSRFFRELASRASAARGIESASVIDNPPLHKLNMSNFFVEGRPDPPIAELPIADMDHCAPGYLAMIGLRLETGRWLTDADMTLTEKGATAVALVNRAFVKQFFPKENPIGHRLLNGDGKFPTEIVGVVSDFRPMGVEGGTRPTIFWPDLRVASASLVLRSSVPPATLAPMIRDLIWAIDKDLPATEIRSMEFYVNEWLSQRRFNTFLLGLFAALALTLGMLGIYGVLAGLVASRVREIGIRMAIGATPRQIGGMVLRQSMTPVAIGLAAGLAASLALGRFLEALLYNLRPSDPVTLTAAMLSVLAIAPLAIWVPLHRATKVECTIALREE